MEPQHHVAGNLVAGRTLANSLFWSWLKCSFLSGLSAGLRWIYSETLVRALKG